jgi:hypothetical protein
VYVYIVSFVEKWVIFFLQSEETIKWTARVRNVKYNIESRIKKNPTDSKRRKADWIGTFLRRTCLLKHVIERKTEVRKDEENDLSSHERVLKLNEEVLDRTKWRTRFGTGYWHVVRQIMQWMNKWLNEWTSVRGMGNLWGNVSGMCWLQWWSVTSTLKRERYAILVSSYPGRHWQTSRKSWSASIAGPYFRQFDRAAGTILTWVLEAKLQ